jgi:DNA-binding CsgD family transcriptional regulator/predicted DNA-binding transcriptional regulator AlpA
LSIDKMSGHLVGVAEIAKMLGVSRQRVDQLIASYPDFPKPEAELSAGRIWSRSAIETWVALHPERGPGVASEERSKLFERFAEDARRVIVAAESEAIAAGHATIEPEHLLAGLLTPASGIALDAMGKAGVTLERVRDAVGEIRRSGDPKGTHPVFSERTRSVLTAAFRRAHRRGLSSIGSVDVLVALVGQERGTVGGFARDEHALRRALVDLGVVGRTVRTVPMLTEREDEVFRLVTKELTDAEIGQRLKISQATVRNHLRNICEKLSMRVRAEEPSAELPNEVSLPDQITARLDEIARRLGSLERRLGPGAGTAT